MIKNVLIKKALTNSIFRGMSFVNRWIPKDDKTILLYSNMEFRDNIRVLYEYMIENFYNKEYKIVCCTPEYKNFRYKSPENVNFVSNVCAIKYFFHSRHVFYCFGKLPIVPSKKQIVIQMWHGTPFKGFDRSMRSKNIKNTAYYTYVFASSETFRKIVSELFQVEENRIVINGQPRTDVFYQRKEIRGKKCKYVIWLPTFRQSSILGYDDTEFKNVLPVFSENDYNELNERLRQYDIQLLVKLHPSQNIKDKIQEYSNLKILSHDQFVKEGLDLYCELRKSDALITDYSSVFYDYLLLDRPLAFTGDDMEEYREKRGFVFEDPVEWMPGPVLKTKEEMYDFLDSVSSENDLYAEKRRKINNKVNFYKDGKNLERTLQISEIKLSENKSDADERKREEGYGNSEYR